MSYLLATGLAGSAVSIFLLADLDAGTSAVDLGWRLAIFGLSIAFMLTTVSTAAINASLGSSPAWPRPPTPPCANSAELSARLFSASSTSPASTPAPAQPPPYTRR